MTEGKTVRRKNYAKKTAKRHNDTAIGEACLHASPDTCPVRGRYTFAGPHDTCPVPGQYTFAEPHDTCPVPGRYTFTESHDICPVCGRYTFAEPHDICPVCGWEQDSVQEADPSFAGGANEMSLCDARKKWEDGSNEDERKE